MAYRSTVRRSPLLNVMIRAADRAARVNWKARALSEKSFNQKLDGESRFWNLDAVLSAGSETVNRNMRV